ncbi:segregation and condensation protein A [Betaproteobacteria bacterium]|nr:segregation and condensation protein A [Betaproteobacteria bacterium]GHU43758.1 segregation and condensation protein A [Betaproteobacteria bacterium]
MSADVEAAVLDAAEAAETETADDALPPALARIYGQRMDTMPQDLYIPPDALEIMLDAFEGPLDLLLYLIRKANIDILDIPMAPLTRQYLDYVDAMRVTHLELAAEYLVMAAMLIEIKSRMLLPRPKVAEGEDAADPRAELVRRLMEYERIKLAAQKINQIDQAERDFLWVETFVEKGLIKHYPEVHLADLQAAWQGILRQARLHKHHQIAREELSVREHMGMILRALRERGGYVQFETLFDPLLGAPALVVHFIAMLELARERLIDITQTEAFQPVYIRQAFQGDTESKVIEEAEDGIE